MRIKKCRQNKGFTFVEMLACVLTLFLICMLCTTGMNFAMKSYNESLFESDSQMLESTLNLYLSDVLRHATDVEAGESGEVIKFTNEAYQIYDGKISTTERTEEDGGNFLVYTTVAGEASQTPLVSTNVYSKTLYIEDFELKYDAATGIFTGRYVIKSTILENERVSTFSCRTIAA